MPKWKPGQSGNIHGRPPGIPNRNTTEVRVWAASILEDEAVRAKTLQQARAGRLAPALIIELFNRAYGKTKDVVEMQNAELPPLIIRIEDAFASAEAETPDA